MIKKGFVISLFLFGKKKRDGGRTDVYVFILIRYIKTTVSADKQV